MTRTFALLFAGLLLTGLIPPRLDAIEDPNLRRLTSGPIGITRFDTIRVNAQCSEGAPGPCVVDFMVEDPNERVLKHATMTLLPGHSDYLDLSAGEVLSMFRDQMRIEVVPVLRFTRGTRVMGNVEEFDTASGRNFAVVVMVEDPNL